MMMIAEDNQSNQSIQSNPTPQKVQVYLKAVGGTAALTKQKFKIDGTKTFLEIEKFLRKNLGTNIAQNASIYLFIGSGFTPGFDQSLQSLFDLFHVGDELVVQYGINEMWG